MQLGRFTATEMEETEGSSAVKRIITIVVFLAAIALVWHLILLSKLSGPKVSINPLTDVAVVRMPGPSNFGIANPQQAAEFEGARDFTGVPIGEHKLNNYARQYLDIYAMVLPYRVSIVDEQDAQTATIPPAVQPSSPSFNRPSIVQDEFGNSAYALVVYEDEKVAVYVPGDITNDRGVLDLQEIQHFGTFSTRLYTYSKETESIEVHMAHVDNNKHIVVIWGGAGSLGRTLVAPEFGDRNEYAFGQVPYPFAQSLQNVVNILQRHSK